MFYVRGRQCSPPRATDHWPHKAEHWLHRAFGARFLFVPPAWTRRSSGCLRHRGGLVARRCDTHQSGRGLDRLHRRSSIPLRSWLRPSKTGRAFPRSDLFLLNLPSSPGLWKSKR